MQLDPNGQAETWVSLRRSASCKWSSSLSRPLLDTYLFTSHSMGPTVMSLLLFVYNSKLHDITSPWCQGVISDDNIIFTEFQFGATNIPTNVFQGITQVEMYMHSDFTYSFMTVRGHPHRGRRPVALRERGRVLLNHSSITLSRAADGCSLSAGDLRPLPIKTPPRYLTRWWRETVEAR